jgi:hypothetical protein
MEKSLILRGHIFGVKSVEVYRACKSVAEMCNYLAMTYLLQGATIRYQFHPIDPPQLDPPTHMHDWYPM